MPEKSRPANRKRSTPTKKELLGKKKEFLVRAKQAGAFRLQPEDIRTANIEIRVADSRLLQPGTGAAQAAGRIQWADSDPTDPYVSFDMDPRDGVVWSDMDPTDPWGRVLDRDQRD